MKQRQLRFGIYLPLLLLFMVSSVVLRTVASFESVDIATGYYVDSLLINISVCLLVAGCIVSATYLFGKNDEGGLTPRYDVAATYVPSGAVSVALIFVAFHFGAKYFDPNKLIAVGTNAIIADTLTLLVAITALLSIIGFFLAAILTRKEDSVRAAFGIATILFITFYSAYLYFDATFPLNSTVKMTDHMAILFTALFFVYETRISLGRGMWRAYIAFGMIAALTTAYSAIPTLILYAAERKMMTASVEECTLIFTFFLFVISRLLLTRKLRSDKRNEFAYAIHLREKERRGLTTRESASENAQEEN